MKRIDDGSTSPTLLEQVAHWDDHLAWVQFRDTYDPYLRRWCRRYGLDTHAIDEVCQRIWLELADRMQTFEYDPGGSFRGWLRRLCGSRVLNYLHERRSHPLFSLEVRDNVPAVKERGIAWDPGEGDRDESESEAEGDGSSGPVYHPLLGHGETIQAAVRARVKPHNWEAFWLVAICDWSVERTAQSLGMTRAAVYAAKQRVARMLRDEGRRAMDQWATGA